MPFNGAARAQTIISRLLAGARDETERRLAPAGVLPGGVDVTKLLGPLWVHGTIPLFFADTTAGSLSLPERYHQRHTVLAVDGHADTAPTGAMTMTIERIRARVRTPIATITLLGGTTETRADVTGDAAGQGGDLYQGTIVTGDSAAVDVACYLDVRVDVIRGQG